MKITDVITEAASPAQQAAIAISMKKAGKKPKSEGMAEGSNKQLKEARRVAGVMTDPQAKTIKDPATGGFIPADDFFAKYPDENKQAWETALADLLDPGKVKAAAGQETAAYNKKFNDVSWMTPEEQAQYKQLQAKDQAATQATGTRTYGAERYLKQLFQQKMDAKKAASMIKVHWAPSKQLESFLQGKVNNKIELSAYLAPNTESLGKTRWTSAYDPTVGIVLDGHITIGGRADLGSDQYKMTAGQRGQQKYVSRPGQIDPTLSMDTSEHHEVLVDNWKIKEIVLPADIPPEIDSLIQQYKIPVRRLGNPQGMAEDKELAEEFDLIESIVEMIAEHNGVDAEAVWEDLESLTEDELYVFAVTSDPLMEDWQKANKRDKTDGMSQKAVNAYRREHPGSKLKTAVTTKPGKLKKGGKASKRRKSYCSRSRGQMKMHSISCAKTPDKAICKARRRWNC